MKEFFSKLNIFFPFLLLAFLGTWQAYSLLDFSDKTPSAFIITSIANFSFYFLLTQWSKKALQIVLVLAFLFSLFIYPSMRVYGKADLNYISSILYTNTGEVFSYLKQIPIKIYVNLLVVFFITLYLTKASYIKLTNHIIPVFLLSYLLTIPFVRYVSYQSEIQANATKPAAFLTNIEFCRVSVVRFPLHFFVSLNKVLSQHNQIIEDSKQNDEWQILNPDELSKIETMVVVIGESVRKDFMHSYGFPIKNTPFISSSAKVQFQNYLATAPNTFPSLCRTLAYSNDLMEIHLNNSIVKLAKKAGYNTYWFSNQGYLGVNDSPVSVLAVSSDFHYRLTGGSYLNMKKDKQLLPYVLEQIETDTSKKVVFVHMAGSHPNPCDRIEGNSDTFWVSNQFSCYIQSIKNTDAFLKEVYQSLKQTNRSFAMIYLSDHGLVYDKNYNMVHGFDVKEMYEVPLLLWSDTLTKTKYIQALRNGKDFIPMFCEILNIETPNISKTYQFLSEETDSAANSVMLDLNKQGDYNGLGRNKLPF